jgi:hypothetical protein
LVLGAFSSAEDLPLVLIIVYAVALVCCCGPCGLFCLPADKEVDNPTVRGLLEGMVVAGWVVGAARWVLHAVYSGREDIHPVAFLTVAVPFYILFVPSPVYFTILCWNNVDWQIMRLLLHQLQFKMVLALALHVIVMDAWRRASLDHIVSSSICMSILLWSPLLMILFIDALHRQSKLFRFAMPAAYLLYVLAGYIFSATANHLLP